MVVQCVIDPVIDDGRGKTKLLSVCRTLSTGNFAHSYHLYITYFSCVYGKGDNLTNLKAHFDVSRSQSATLRL